MKKLLYIMVPLALLIALVGKLAMNKKTAVEKVYHYDREQTIKVRAQKLTIANVASGYSFTGTFEPNRETKISAEVQGKVHPVLVENGSTVKKGQVVIKLDDALLQWQLKAAEVQMGGLETDLQRYRILVENEAIQGVQLEKTELAIQSAQVQANSLKEQIKKTSILAPFDGVVTAKLTEEGDFAVPGKPLLQITDIGLLKFTLQVPEQHLKLFEIGMEHAVTIPTLAIQTTGKVHMVGSRGNPSNSFPVEILVKNTADQDIKAGMFGELSLQRESGNGGFLIPSSTIVGSDLSPQVYLVRNGKAALQDIKIEKRLQDKVVINSGLIEGDTLITSGLINVFEGANVHANL